MPPRRKVLTTGVLLFAGAMMIFLACKHNKRRWILDTPVEDLVHHTLLDIADIGVVDLPPRIYEEELMAFVTPFVEDAKKYGINIPKETQNMLRQVVYVDKLSMQGGPGVMAACNRYYTYQKTVSGRKKLNWMTIEVLRKESRDYTGDDESKRLILLREIMYHEIFHCFFNKGHLPPGKSGIMSATFTKGNKRAFRQWPALVEEMFSKEYIDLIPDAS